MWRGLAATAEQAAGEQPETVQESGWLLAAGAGPQALAGPGRSGGRTSQAAGCVATAVSRGHSSLTHSCDAHRNHQHPSPSQDPQGATSPVTSRHRPAPLCWRVGHTGCP